MTLTYIRPDADDTDGTWTNESDSQTNLFASIDESVASDADYIKSVHLPDHDICKIRLSDPAFITMRPATVHYRFRKRGEAATQINLDVSLLQGTTEIAKWSETDIATSYVDGSQALTVAQFNSISDFTNLYLQFDAFSSWWLANSEVDLWFEENEYHLSTSLSSASFLLHADGADASTTFIDATGRHQLIRNLNTTCEIDTAQSKFGGASLLTGGTLDYITLSQNQSDFTFGTGDFTIDFWYRAGATIIHSGSISFGDGSNDAFYIRTFSDKILYVTNVSGNLIAGSTVLSENTWYHIALTRSGGNSLKLFLNGVQEGSTYTGTTSFPAPLDSNYPKFGGGNSLNLDELRVLKGTAAWTTTFTPPTAPYNVALSGPYAHLSCSRASIGYAKTSSGTLTQFAANALRITDSGLLIEDTRTNIQTYSQSNFSPQWNANNLQSRTDDITTAPDGTTTASLLVESTANANHGVYLNQSQTAVTYCASCFFKKKERTFAYMTVLMNASADRYGAVVNLDTGVITATGTMGSPTIVSSGVETYGSGWYRLWIVYTDVSANAIPMAMGLSNSATPTFSSAEPTYTGDGTSGVYIWGAMRESGSFPSSYIPTTSAAATRAAEVVTCIGNLAFIGADTNQSGVVDAKSLFASGRMALVNDNGASGNTRLEAYSDNQTAQQGGVANLGSGLWTTGAKGGWSKSSTLGSVVGMGGTVNTSFVAAAGFSAGEARLGSQIGIGPAWYGYYRRLTVWNSRLADATLQTLTDPAHTTNFTTDAATIDLDFANAAYNSVTLPTDFLICSRASIGYAKTVAGTLQQFAANQLRITDSGLLVEDARTNYMFQSADFSTTWSANNVTVATDQIAAPDGTVTADKLLTSNTSDPTVRTGHDVTTVASTIYTFSCYLKAGSGGTWVRLELGSNDGGNVTRQWFNLSGAGSLGTHSNGASATVFWDSASIEALANGWYRCAISGHGTSTNIIFYDPICGPFSADNTTTGSGVNDFIYAWGAQFEVGAFPSSYIPTTSSSATRAADVITTTGSLSSLLVASAASIVADLKADFANAAIVANDGAYIIVELASALSPLAMDFNFPNTQADFRPNSGTIQSNTFGNSLTLVSGVKIASGWDSVADTESIVGGGATVATGTSALTALSAPVAFCTGSITGGKFMGTVRRFTAWTSKLADATLQGFTNP